MKKKTRWIILLIILPFTFALFAFWGSVGDSNLESYVKDKVVLQIIFNPTTSYKPTQIAA